MSKTPFISIIMPVYNAQMYLNEAVNSIVNQTISDWELLLIDDKSTDESLRLCNDWAKKDDRITVIPLEKNGGAGNARNIGIENAQGKYITFVDADDIIDSDLYQNVVGDVSDCEYDILVWGVTEEYVDESGQHISTNVLSVEDKKCTSVEQVRKCVISLEDKTLFGYQCNHLYKANLIKEHNVRFEKVILYEDYFFNLSAVEHAGSMKISSNTGYHYYKRGNQSVTNRFVPEYFLLSRRRVKSMVCAYKRWNLFNSRVKNSSGQRYLRYCLSALMRNNDSRANMTHKARVDWVKSIYKDSLYNEIAKDGKVESKVLKILQLMLKLKCTWLCLLMGKVVYYVKVKKPNLYVKKGQIH